MRTPPRKAAAAAGTPKRMSPPPRRQSVIPMPSNFKSPSPAAQRRKATARSTLREPATTPSRSRLPRTIKMAHSPKRAPALPAADAAVEQGGEGERIVESAIMSQTHSTNESSNDNATKPTSVEVDCSVVLEELNHPELLQDEPCPGLYAVLMGFTEMLLREGESTPASEHFGVEKIEKLQLLCEKGNRGQKSVKYENEEPKKVSAWDSTKSEWIVQLDEAAPYGLSSADGHRPAVATNDKVGLLHIASVLAFAHMKGKLRLGHSHSKYHRNLVAVLNSSFYLRGCGTLIADFCVNKNSRCFTPVYAEFLQKLEEMGQWGELNVDPKVVAANVNKAWDELGKVETKPVSPASAASSSTADSFMNLSPNARMLIGSVRKVVKKELERQYSKERNEDKGRVQLLTAGLQEAIAEKDEALGTVNSLEAKMAALEEEKSSANREIAELRESLKRSQLELKSQQIAVKNIACDLEESKTRVAVLESAVGSKNQTIDELQHKLGESMQQPSELESLVNTSNSNLVSDTEKFMKKKAEISTQAKMEKSLDEMRISSEIHAAKMRAKGENHVARMRASNESHVAKMRASNENHASTMNAYLNRSGLQLVHDDELDSLIADQSTAPPQGAVPENIEWRQAKKEDFKDIASEHKPVAVRFQDGDKWVYSEVVGYTNNGRCVFAESKLKTKFPKYLQVHS